MSHLRGSNSPQLSNSTPAQSQARTDSHQFDNTPLTQSAPSQRPKSAHPSSRPSQAIATHLEEHHVKFFPDIAPLKFAHTDAVLHHLLSLLNDASRLVRTSISLSQVSVPGDILTTEEDPHFSEAEQVPLVECIDRFHAHLSTLEGKSLHPARGHYRPHTAPANRATAANTTSTSRFRKDVGLEQQQPRGDPVAAPSTVTRTAKKPVTTGTQSSRTPVQPVAMASVPEPSRPAPAAEPKPAARVGAEAFEFGDELGTGAYGKVVLATKKDTGEKFAAKVLSKTRVLKENKMKYVQTERNLLNIMNHPGLIKLRYTFQDEQRLYFVLELAEGGELTDRLTGKPISLAAAKHYAAEILLAIEHMHSKNVIHRDLKPPNILLDKDAHVKITDFGTAAQLAKGQQSLRKSSFVGSADYVSPELLEEDAEVTYAADLWAWAVLLYQMIAGSVPFKAASEFLLFQEITSVNFTFPDGFDAQAQELIAGILVKDAKKRLGMGIEEYDEIKDHPFFDGIDWDSVFKTAPPAF